MAKEIKITCECQHSMTVEQLQAFQGKLKSIDSEAFDKLKASIVKYGFSFPIFVWNDQILDGHQRLAAVKKLIDEGYTLKADLLPVVPIQAKDRKEAAEKLLLINSRYAKIDQDGFDFFVQDFDIDVADMSGLLDIPEIDFDVEEEEFKGNTDPDDVPEVEETPVTKMGDIWLLGEHRLLCGDSTKAEDVERLMDGEKADMVFTDIPYNISRKSNGLRNLDYGEWDKDVHDIGLKSFYLDIAESFYYFCGDYQLSEILLNFNSNGLSTRTFVWHKPNPTVINGEYIWLPSNELCAFGRKKGAIFNFKCEHAFFDGPSPSNRSHPNQKSFDLVSRCILASSVNSVIDLFSGSGTTIIAAQQTKRKCYAMEISPQYVDVAVKRWQDFSGEDAVLERTGETFEEIKNA